MGLTRNGWTRKRGNDIKGYSHQFELKRVHLSDSYGRDASRRCAARSVSTWRDSLPAETPKQLQPAKTNGIEASTGETEKKTRIFINTPKNVRCACRRMTKEFTSKCDVENSHLLFLPPIRWRPYKVEKSLLKRCTGRLFFTWRVVFRLCVSVVISHFTLFFSCRSHSNEKNSVARCLWKTARCERSWRRRQRDVAVPSSAGWMCNRLRPTHHQTTCNLRPSRMYICVLHLKNMNNRMRPPSARQEEDGDEIVFLAPNHRCLAVTVWSSSTLSPHTVHLISFESRKRFFFKH